MKKIVGWILVLMMTASCFGGAVFAEENLESLVLSVKQRLEIPEEYDSLSTERFNNGNTETLRLEWQNKDKSNIIAAEVRFDGVITSFYDSSVNRVRGISKFSKEQAIGIAKEWLEKVNPSLADEYIFDIDDVYMGYGITVPATRFSDGARIVGDGLTVRIDSQTGKITDMNLIHTAEKFDVPENIISKEEAKAKFTENTNLMPAYLKSGEGAVLVYIDYEASFAPAFGIDAVTGAKVEIEKSNFRETAGGGAFSKNEAKEDMAADKELSQQEIEELSKYESYITAQDGEVKIKSIEEFGISDYSLERYSYQKQYMPKEEDNTDEVILSLTFRKENSYAYGELDAVTGEILSFFCNPNKENESAKITSAQAEQLAKSLAEKTAGDKICKMVVSAEKNGGLTQEIVYLEMVNGTPYLGSRMNITVDKGNGTVTDYSANWSKEELTFESGENVIAPNMARKAYASECGYELGYVDVLAGESIVYSKESRPYEYVLVYQKADAPYCISAVTGKRLTADGKEETEPLTAYSDLEGHWAKSAITALADNGYLTVEESNFRPDDSITYEEARNIMRNAELYRSFGEANDEIMTREEAVKGIIYSAGYEKAANLSEIYVPVFGDWEKIAPENRGYVALAKGFNVIKGDQNGMFNPAENVTRGAFAVMIYNYISSGQLD